MEIGPTARTPVPPSVHEPSRAASPPPASVRTELPRDAALPPAASPEKSAGARPRAQPSGQGDYTSRDVSLDIETRKVVFKVVDERSGEVVTQFPDPRYLKAYLEQMRAVSTPDKDASPLAERLA